MRASINHTGGGGFWQALSVRKSFFSRSPLSLTETVIASSLFPSRLMTFLSYTVGTWHPKFGSSVCLHALSGDLPFLSPEDIRLRNTPVPSTVRQTMNAARSVILVANVRLGGEGESKLCPTRQNALSAVLSPEGQTKSRLNYPVLTSVADEEVLNTGKPPPVLHGALGSTHSYASSPQMYSSSTQVHSQQSPPS